MRWQERVSNLRAPEQNKEIFIFYSDQFHEPDINVWWLIDSSIPVGDLRLYELTHVHLSHGGLSSDDVALHLVQHLHLYCDIGHVFSIKSAK